MAFRKWLLMGCILLIGGMTIAQDSCPILVQEALSSLDTHCETTERNQACYGNISLTATPQEDAATFKFDTIGDIANLNDIDTLDLAPLDTSAGTWGLVMMRVQADIPDTLPGQNVTFVLFGDVTIQNAAQDEQNPMQAFYLTTGIGDANCAEAPESGLMVQTPDGVKEVTFNVNGVDVEMGSTVIFQAQPGQQMRVKTVEGKARITINDEVIPIVQGSEYVAPMTENFEVSSEGDVAPYQEEKVEVLPLQTLERKIEIVPPLTTQQIDEVEQREEAGERLCSDEAGSYLPACTKPLHDANGEDVRFDGNGNVILTDETGLPLFYDKEGNPILSQDDYYRHYSYWVETPVIQDAFGNTIEVAPDGTVSIQDIEGNILVATPDGSYTYIGVDGATQVFDETTVKGELLLDENGQPVIREDVTDDGIILPLEEKTPAPDVRPDITTNDPVPTFELNPLDIKLTEVPLEIRPVEIPPTDVPLDVRPIDIKPTDVPLDLPPIDFKPTDVPLDLRPIDIKPTDPPLNFRPTDEPPPEPTRG